jgi:hypothetical protein
MRPRAVSEVAGAWTDTLALMRPLRAAYVLFNNTEMWAGARRFRSMVRR